MNNISIYIHIPFCLKKCKYCDFLSAPASKPVQEAYLHALTEEIIQKSIQYKDYVVNTIYIGGGTPSVVEAGLLCSLLHTLFIHYCIKENAEISMEINPGTVTKDTLKLYKEAGINRLSIGLQSTDNKELMLLGRIHTYEDFLITYQNAREVGFDNINIDLMQALPGQTLENYRKNLERVISLKPEHISAYSLIVEEGTRFYELYGEEKELLEKTGEGLGNLPDEEQEREMSRLTDDLLKEAGYRHYEISNYARKDKECKHNLVYWRRKAYIGFGLGAASLFEDVRWCNEKVLDTYIGNPLAEPEREYLTKEDAMAEFMFLGLRTYDGVRDEDFKEAFGESMYAHYGSIIDKNKKEGLLTGTHTLVLTPKGFCFANYVMAQFLPE